MMRRRMRWTGWLAAGLACCAWCTQAATVQVDVVDDAGRPVAGDVAVLIGVTGPATIVGSFVFGLPSIIAVIYAWMADESVAAIFAAGYLPGLQ